MLTNARHGVITTVDGAGLPQDYVTSGFTPEEERQLAGWQPDGRSVRMLVNVTPIRIGDGDIESVVVTMQDLVRLEELERLRVKFLGMVSHELRAPLTSIKGSTTTLLGTSRTIDRAELRQFIRIIDEQADHMQGLISDLLDAGRIDSGTLSVDPEPLEVAALVEQARTTFLSAGGRQPIRIDLPADLPRVMADERRIVQVLKEAARLVRTRKPNLVLLDLVLPEIDGIELMQSVPGMADVPVIFISGYGRDETVVRALEAGAADYIVKPFSASELTARVRATLRRQQGAEPFVLGALTIDYAHRQVTMEGRAVKLTLTEHELLRVLSLNAGRVVA